jgi:hypothetical protein
VVRGQRAILRRRDAKSVKRAGLSGQKLDHRPCQNGLEMCPVGRALLVRRPRVQQLFQIRSMQARCEMGEPYETSKHAMAVKAARKLRDPPPSQKIPRLPVFACRGIQMRTKPCVIGLHIARVGGAGEEAEQGAMIGDTPDRRELEPVEGHVSRVQVHRRHAPRLGHEVARHIAAAGRDRHHMVRLLDAERVHVDDRVLPYLGIDKPAEHKCKQTLEQSLDREGAVLVNGCRKLDTRAASFGLRRIHAVHPRCEWRGRSNRA